MSTSTFPVTDEGLVVKLEEIDVTAFINFVKENFQVNLEDEEDDRDILDIIRDFLCEDCQMFLGKDWSDGVIYHKETCGNDVSGEFVPLLSTVKYTDINVSVEGDDWIMMCLPRYTNLFSKAYQNEQELIDEIKKLYGNFLNSDFPFEKRLVSLRAVAWG